MLGPVELSVLSKSASNVSLMILLLKVFVRYLTQVFVKNALIDPHAKFQICWDQLFTFFANKWQKIDPFNSQIFFAKCLQFASFRKGLNDLPLETFDILLCYGFNA